jgi:U3 small nucleolar RNA-associated protein 6
VPKIELFESLKALITEYPSQTSVREANLAHLFDVLRLTLVNDGRGIKLLAGRLLGPEVKGEELVEKLRCTNEEMMQIALESEKEEVLQVYAEFVEEWWGRVEDENLVCNQLILIMFE